MRGVIEPGRPVGGTTRRPAKVAWMPLDGSQTLFVSCPVYEVLNEGTRGSAKTDALLMSFARYVGQGFGRFWRGILFRQTYPQLADVVARTQRWFPLVFPGARFNESSYTWKFPDGETLLLRHMKSPKDYWNYHGHEYPWIGWEELTNWANLECYEAMKACSRSSHPGMPRMIRANANPFGIGHHVAKSHFIDPAPAGVVVTDAQGLGRVRIRSHWSENAPLLAADPDYPRRLAADTNVNRRKAWFGGSWDVVAGGFFDDLWDRDTHVLRPFTIPPGWHLDRAFDWGSAKPFSVGWWAESDGSPATLADGTQRTFPRGTLVRVAEWYGWNGKPNEGCRMSSADIAKGIRESEQRLGRPVKAGPADSSIYDVEDGHSIAGSMQKAGVTWLPANKGPGSRKNGWELMRERFFAALMRPKEDAGLYAFDTCTHYIRTVPVLPRDEVKPDDIDTNAEDHVGDETRYRVLAPRSQATVSSFSLTR